MLDERVLHEGFSQFWKELPSVKMDELSRVMVLPTLPGTSPLPKLKSLYVRESYEQLTALATDGSGKDILVTGSPGIGKSTWLLHLLHRLASTGQTVVVDKANAHTQLELSFLDELDVSSNYYLVDGQLPTAAAARRIETCSPTYPKIWGFIKEGAKEMVMPPWTQDELEAALPLFPDVSLERLRKLYSMWGGSVCWTLARADCEMNEYYLEIAIDTCNLDDLQRPAVGGWAAAEELSGLLVHYIPDKDLRPSHFAMASPYVSDRVCEVLLDRQQQDLGKFLAEGVAEYGVLRDSLFGVLGDSRGVLRDSLFESYTSLMQQRGGTFTVRYLDTGEEEVVKLKPGSLHRFPDLSEVTELPDNSHYRPVSRSCPSIDFLRQPNDIVQVTRNFRHDPLETACIRDCFKVLRAGSDEAAGPVYLTYVVPHDMYPKVHKIPMKGRLDATKFPIRQRIMRMPLMQAGALAPGLKLL